MLSTRATWTLCTVSLVLVVIIIAHLHPSSGFTLPVLPSGRLFEPVYVHDLFQPEDRLLNTTQCLDTYPALYYEADRARRWYTTRSGITEKMVDAAEKDGGNARLTIINNQLYVKHYGGGINTRTQAMLATVYSIVITSPEPMPDVDFVIQTSDGGGGDHPHFVLDRKEDQPHMWLMPDFGFFSWPEPGVGAYSEVRDKTLAYEESMGLQVDGSDVVRSNWSKKIPKLFWRGSPMVEVRHDLLRGSENQPWSDVKALDWGAVNSDDEDRKAKAGDLKTPAEHCEYAFLAHVEGWAYSGRLKYLQQCRSVIVMHPLEWIQHYHHLFNSKHNDPDQNVVEVPLPLETNLPSVMEMLLAPENQEMAERIANNSWNFLRQGYISPSANACYFRYALKAYAEVQRFQPVLDRGVPYESFLLMGKTHWDPHR